MKHRLLVLAISIFVPVYSNAQSGSTALPKIISPAPEAANISKYGLYPVSMFTGLPNISIPVYNILVGDYSLPISLDYHASGIKVNDLASCVGLGWNINAGGVITRTVMGVPDEDVSRGIFHLNIKREDQITETDYALLMDVTNTDVDSEPDIFSYNFGGQSGKFIIGPGKQILMIPHNNLKVKYDNDLFSITDVNGTIYKFGKTSFSTSFNEYSSPKYYPTTSWYLSTVILKNKVDSITFTYSGYTPGRMETYDYHMSLGRIPTQGPVSCNGLGCSYSMLYPTNAMPELTVNYDNYSFLYVKNITFPRGKVDFVFNTTRSDHGHILDQIIVTNDNNKIIKQVNLTHTYFYNTQGYNPYALPQDQYRLKLTEVNEMGTTGTTPLKHRFEYEEQYQLPPRKNFGIDTWGYYNGKNTNQHLLTLNEFGRQYSFVDISGMSSVSNIQNPADRTVNEDYMKAGMLKRIYYPTGGYSDFEFEANRISTSKTIEKPGTTIFVAAKKDDPAGDTTRVSVFISPVTVSTTATIPATLTLNLPLWSDIKKPEIIFQNLSKGTFERYRTYPGDATFRTVNIALYEGDQYKISSSIYPNPNDPNDDTDEDVLATVKWPSGQTQVINVVQKGPGLRIKSIKSYEMTGNLAKQEDYRYGTNESGFGKISFFDYLFTANTYVQNYVYCIPDANSPQLISYPYAVNKLEILSKPIFNYSDFGGSSIFYPEVSKYQISTGGDNGKTVYNYDYELDDKVESTYPEPQLLVSADWKSGNLLSEKAYKRKTDNTYQLISETINEYGLFMIDTVFGLKVRQNTIYYGGGTCMPSRTATHTRATLDKDFKFFEYPVFSGVKKVINSTSKIYSEDNSALTNKTTYTYNNYSHLLPNITTYINSKGEIVKKADRYPHDKALIAGITPAESAAIDSMIARNMVETMIEREETINDTPVNKSHMEFGMWGAFVALKKYKLQKGNNSMFDKFEIFNYDTHGNILEQSNGNNAHEVYLWGYNSSYPVARVQNSTYSMVSGIVNSSIIQQPLTTDALQNELSKLYNVQLLPNCLVNTFSYEPLLGLTTMKDAGGKTMYYEYDSFGRLKTVRDPDGKVVKFYDYQYQQALNK